MLGARPLHAPSAGPIRCSGGLAGITGAPALAAYLAVSIELTASDLLMLGLATRPVALVLGLAVVIGIFANPLAWPTHWAAMLLVLLCPGAGNWSLDRLLSYCISGLAARALTGRLTWRKASKIGRRNTAEEILDLPSVGTSIVTIWN